MKEQKKQRRKGKRGRRSIAEMDPAEVRQEIRELIEDLGKATDPDDKKRLRRSLRRRGRTGGLKGRAESEREYKTRIARARKEQAIREKKAKRTRGRTGGLKGKGKRERSTQ